MKYLLPTLLLFITIAGHSQTKRYLYYFDKDFNSVEQSKAVFYGSGEYEDGLLKLMVYNTNDKQLVMVEHFTDSTLQTSEGLFQSYTANNLEVEGNYVKGQEDGLWKKWNQAGNIIDSSFYEHGKIIRQTLFNYTPGNHIESTETTDLQNGKSYKSVYDEAGRIIATDTTVEATATPAAHEDEDKVFIRTEIEATFPGGDRVWQKYIDKKMAEHSDELNRGETCTIRFIVNKDGSVREPAAINGNVSALAKIIAEALMKGPKWAPAQQNGRYVTAYKIIHVKYTGAE